MGRTKLGKQMHCYVVVDCGANPTKTTAAQVGPLNNQSEPVTWNDTTDLEISITDEFIRIRVYDTHATTADDLVGSANISVSDLCSRMRGASLKTVKSLEDESSQLMWMRNERHFKDAGRITYSVYATQPHRPLPPVLPG